jgi:Holliday junction DNA helicase RuvA
MVSGLGSVGDEVRLHTQLYIRDERAELYGFSTPESLRLFNLLNGVSGIGPRIALGLLSTLGPSSLVSAIATENLGALSSVSGVGARTAGRLVLELKGKVEQEMEVVPGSAGDQDGDVVAALMALGYSANEARKVVTSMTTDGEATLEGRLRTALRQLAG